VVIHQGTPTARQRRRLGTRVGRVAEARPNMSTLGGDRLRERVKERPLQNYNVVEIFTPHATVCLPFSSATPLLITEAISTPIHAFAYLLPTPMASGRILHPGTLRCACVKSSMAPDGSMSSCGRKQRKRRGIDGTFTQCSKIFRFLSSTDSSTSPHFCIYIYVYWSTSAFVPHRTPALSCCPSVFASRRSAAPLQKVPPLNNCLFTPNGSIHAALVSFSVTSLN
jgi:hypothetical protein